MISTVIIDDESKNVNLLQYLLGKHCPEFNIVATAFDVNGAIKCINKHKPQMVFLDIDLGDGTAFDVLKMVDYSKFEIVFATAHQEYAIKTFEYSALHYILKPYSVEALRETVSRYENKHRNNTSEKIKTLLESLSDSPNRIVLPDTYGLRIVDIDNILRAEADSCYTNVILNNGDKILFSKSLSAFSSLLPEHLFTRIHSKHLVNLDHISEYINGRGGYVILDTQERIDVSHRKKKDFIEALRKHAVLSPCME